jgi:inosine-uridine nucleoside N-ribohydrolase
VRLWIDTDVGDNPDDDVALACAHAHPDVEVVGVSVVGGRFAERVARARRHVDAPVHVPDGDLEARVRAARPDALLAIGPLTNVPRLRDGAPTAPLTVMGGVIRPVRHRGEVREVEHNLGADPAAAGAVLGDHRPVVLVPLDVTVRMTVDGELLARLVAAIPGLGADVARWAARVAAASTMHGEEVREAEVRVVLHDPLALLVCARDRACGAETRRRALAVDPTGRLVDGGVAHDVVVDADTVHALARVEQLVG